MPRLLRCWHHNSADHRPPHRWDRRRYSDCWRTFGWSPSCCEHLRLFFLFHFALFFLSAALKNVLWVASAAAAWKLYLKSLQVLCILCCFLAQYIYIFIYLNSFFFFSNIFIFVEARPICGPSAFCVRSLALLAYEWKPGRATVGPGKRFTAQVSSSYLALPVALS